MEEQYRQAFAEVLYIIDSLDSSNKNKISKKFIDFLERNKSNNYKLDLPELPLENPDNLKKQTKIILALIYREYLCDEQKKEEFRKKDEQELKKIMEQYPVDIFSKKDNQSEADEKASKSSKQSDTNNEQSKNLPVKVKKTGLWGKIKSFFGRLLKRR